MGHLQVLSSLLENSPNKKNDLNIHLLKKLLLCVYHGWFRINGQSPDRRFSLADYLLDEERLILDYSRVNDAYREKFLHWFLLPHCKEAKREFLSGVTTTDHRGFTTEVGLSLWGRLTNLIYYKKKSYWFHLSRLELSLQYQLLGLEICEGEHGLLIGFNQFLSPWDENKYLLTEPRLPFRNTKRVILTESLINFLMQTDFTAANFIQFISNPHPYAIKIKSIPQRQNAMLAYRQTQGFIQPLPWYQKLWLWLCAWFRRKPQENPLERAIYANAAYLSSFSQNSQPLNETMEFPVKEALGAPVKETLETLVETDRVCVFQRHPSEEILITEVKPDLDSKVFCGGGIKIYGHIGAYRAFEEMGLKAKRFAGSSAGAIMAILAYLGYSAKEILILARYFNKDNLVHYEIDRHGLSNSQAIKSALDYIITRKINEIITTYQINHTPEGRHFLQHIIFKKNGEINLSFAALRALKKHYPQCSLGEDLTITATIMKRRKTRYFSYWNTPDMEISEAGKISASFPLLYKPTILEGEFYNDGALLNNFPTEVFRDDYSTLLESTHGNCLSLVCFQFDNGFERSLLDRFVQRVYRENFFLNWIYSVVTGVKDPVSAWEKDRLKLLQHSNQVVVIPINDVAATQFNLDYKSQNRLIRNGYTIAKEYIAARYCCKNNEAMNDELLYEQFSSLEELLCFCCHRGRTDWFERLAPLAQNVEGLELSRIAALRKHCIATAGAREVNISEGKKFLFSSEYERCHQQDFSLQALHIFEAIYTFFLNIPGTFVKNSKDQHKFYSARFNLSIHHPFACISLLDKMKGETHLFLALFIYLLKSYQNSLFEHLFEKLKLLNVSLQKSKNNLNHPVFYHTWQLEPPHIEFIFDALLQPDWESIKKWCFSLKDENIKGKKDKQKHFFYSKKDGEYLQISESKAECVQSEFPVHSSTLRL